MTSACSLPEIFKIESGNQYTRKGVHGKSSFSTQKTNTERKKEKKSRGDKAPGVKWIG